MLYIVDDEVDIQGALKWIADTRNINCATFSSGEELLAALNISIDGNIHDNPDNPPKIKFDPAGDCIILDVRMPGISGIATFDILAKNNLTNRLPVIFITGHGEVAGAVEALKRGAFDFFEKPFDDNALFGQAMIGLEKSQKESELSDMQKRFETLTNREREILSLILTGKMNKVIGDTLGISMRTVEVHRANILEKMGVKTAMELAALIR